MKDNARKLTEADFQQQVIDLARAAGWRVAHFRPARTANGWHTPVAADGAGFPDLILCHEGRGEMLAVELKAEGGKLTRAQREWLLLLDGCGVNTVIWRPSGWDEIERVLARR